LYKEIPVNSDSFKKSTEALNLVEQYNYSVVFGIPSYNENFEHDFFEPDLQNCSGMFANYVNKSTIKLFKKIDSDALFNDSLDNIHSIETVYAIKVIPEKNIRSIFRKTIGLDYPENVSLLLMILEKN
jgi:hypothetical protein